VPRLSSHRRCRGRSGGQRRWCREGASASSLPACGGGCSSPTCRHPGTTPASAGGRAPLRVGAPLARRGARSRVAAICHRNRASGPSAGRCVPGERVLRDAALDSFAAVGTLRVELLFCLMARPGQGTGPLVSWPARWPQPFPAGGLGSPKITRPASAIPCGMLEQDSGRTPQSLP
jgi:hypothetical protein